MMKSPFPGMDPYVEAHGNLWDDFYQHLIEDVYRTIAAALPDNYVVQSQPRAYLLLSETDGKQQRPFIPDVGVSTAGPDRTTKTSVAVAEPTTDTEPQTLRAF